MRSADDIFHDACEITDPARRAAYLDEACADDAELRAKVDELLRADAELGGFLASRAGGQTTLEPVALSERAGSRIGPYKLLQVIGEGGFGTVFLSEQSEPVRRKVALKVIKLGMDSRQVIARFEAERQALAMMNHPHIARVFDGGVTDSGRPYFVMEYVIGEAITEFCDTGTLSVPERLELFRQVCSAVQHAHTKGIIHRDLKPANVLVSMVDGKPFARVIDFGIAKATASPLTDKTLFTEHRQLIGTPEYMSPEQAEGSPDIDTRTDVYALGVLLYELLTGLTPFDAKRLRSAAYGEMQRIIKEEEPLAPSLRLTRSPEILAATAARRRTEPARLGLQMQGELDWIVMKALDKDRARRYESAARLASDVGNHLAGEAVMAAPPSAGYRLRKFVSRHKAHTTLLLTLLVGIAGTTAGLIVAQYNAKAALNNASLAIASRDELKEVNQSLATKTEEAEWSAYTANIFAALSDPYSARRYLDACAERLRNWEWRYLQAISDASLVVLQAPGDERAHWNQVTFAADGELVVALADTGQVFSYRARTGELVCASNGDTEILSIHASPSGTVIAVMERISDPITGDKTFRYEAWDCRTLQGKFALPGQGMVSPSGDAIYAAGHMLCSSDGTTLATIDSASRYRYHDTKFASNGTDIVTWGFYSDGELNYRIDLWDGNTGEQLRSVDGLPNVVDLHVAGDTLLTTHHGEYRTWDAESLAPIGTFEAGPWTHAAVSSDGRSLYTHSSNNDARIYAVSTGKIVQRFADDELGVYGGKFSPDASRLVTGSGPYVCVWDVKTGARLAKLPGHEEAWINPTYSPDGTMILSGGWDGTARLWDANRPPISSFEAVDDPFHRAGSESIRKSIFNGTHVLAPSRNREATVALVDVNTGDTTASWSVPAPEDWDGPAGFDDAFFSPDGTRVFTRRGSSVRAWDASTAAPLGKAIVPVHIDNPEIRSRSVSMRHAHAPVHQPVSLACNNAGSRLLTCLGNGLARVYNMDDGRVVLEADGEGYPCGALSHDGSTAAIAWSNHAIQIYDVESGRLLDTLNGHTDAVTDILFDCNGHFLATRSEDRTIRLWDTRTGDHRVLAEIDEHAFDNWFAYDIGTFNHRGDRLAFFLGTECVVVETTTGKVVSELQGHAWPINHSTFSPDGSRVFTSSGDNTIRVWETATGREVMVLRPEVSHEDGFDMLQLSPDGSRLVARYAYDSTIHVYDTVPFRHRASARQSTPP